MKPCALRRFGFPALAQFRPGAALWLLGVLCLVLPAPRLTAAAFDLANATVADIQAAYAAGALNAEKLTALYLKRIETYEPTLNAVLALNPRALEEARALDAERVAKGPRSPLHGIPVVLKDNFDTTDLPTTGGFFGLKGSLPLQDATVVARLRAAGAIILAKTNMSEFASGGAMSSVAGAMRNPHALDRAPGGSSGGSGVAIAAYYAPIGFGTDTGGSIRSPSTTNGIVGLKPTLGLLSRAGIIPLSLSLDTGGPMTRSVYDVAVSLNVTARGEDLRDPVTRFSAGNTVADYTRGLDAGALQGARIGVARGFLGQDADVDAVFESALATLKAKGAVLIDVQYPDTVLKIRNELYNAVRKPEFKAQIADYLATLRPGYPKTLMEILAMSEKVIAPRADGVQPNPGRLTLYRQEVKMPALSDPIYRAAIEQGMPFVRASLAGVFEAHQLDAIVYPTNPKSTARVGEEPPSPSGVGAGAPTNSPYTFANLTGFPELTIPAGFNSNRLPVGISFFGRAWSEPRLLALGYAYEQASQALRVPVHAPALAGERFEY